jgi:pimeloyl-ACP methyl ester carboxylesterase
MMVIEDNSVKVKDVETHYLKAGKGSPLVLLPSGSGRAREYEGVLTSLSTHHTVYSFDYPGFGASGEFDRITGTEDLACFLGDFADVLHLSHFHLLGYSMGGWVALHFAIRFPQRVRKLILAATSGVRLKEVPIANPTKMSAREILDSFYYNPKVRLQVASRKLSDQDRQEINRSSQALARLIARKKVVPDLGDRLLDITSPTLILSAEEDRVVPPKHQRILHEKIWGSKLVTFSQCGHDLLREHPQRLVKEVVAFLK